MPYKRKNSLYWWSSFTDADGKRVRRSLGTTDRKEAEVLEAKWKVEIYNATNWGKQIDRSFDDLMLDYLTATKDTKRSWERDVRCAKQLRAVLGGRLMSDISPKDIWGYQTKRKQDGVKPVTINRELAYLSTAINFANRHWEWDLSNPVKGRKLSNVESTRTRWLTHAEADRLLEAASSEPKAPHLSDFIRLALFTGARRGELLGLEWSRVDIRANVIHLEAVHTKTGIPRSIPLHKETRQALIGRQRFRASFCPDASFVFVNHKGCPIRSIKRSFATACRRADIADFRIHDLRHTFATWCVTDGVSLLELRLLLGHSTIKMTERYAHLAMGNLKSAVDMLEHRSHSGHSTQPQQIRSVVSH